MIWSWILGAVISVAWFAVFETISFNHPDRMNTLSRSVATLGARWPLSIFLLGLFVGVLASHFFWPGAS